MTLNHSTEFIQSVIGEMVNFVLDKTTDGSNNFIVVLMMFALCLELYHSYFKPYVNGKSGDLFNKVWGLIWWILLAFLFTGLTPSNTKGIGMLRAEVYGSFKIQDYESNNKFLLRDIYNLVTNLSVSFQEKYFDLDELKKHRLKVTLYKDVLSASNSLCNAYIDDMPQYSGIIRAAQGDDKIEVKNRTIVQCVADKAGKFEDVSHARLVALKKELNSKRHTGFWAKIKDMSEFAIWEQIKRNFFNADNIMLMISTFFTWVAYIIGSIVYLGISILAAFATFAMLIYAPSILYSKTRKQYFSNLKSYLTFAIVPATMGFIMFITDYLVIIAYRVASSDLTFVPQALFIGIGALIIKVGLTLKVLSISKSLIDNNMSTMVNIGNEAIAGAVMISGIALTAGASLAGPMASKMMGSGLLQKLKMPGGLGGSFGGGGGSGAMGMSGAPKKPGSAWDRVKPPAVPEMSTASAPSVQAPTSRASAPTESPMSAPSAPGSKSVFESGSSPLSDKKDEKKKRDIITRDEDVKVPTKVEGVSAETESKSDLDEIRNMEAGEFVGPGKEGTQVLSGDESLTAEQKAKEEASLKRRAYLSSLKDSMWDKRGAMMGFAKSAFMQKGGNFENFANSFIPNSEDLKKARASYDEANASVGNAQVSNYVDVEQRTSEGEETRNYEMDGASDLQSSMEGSQQDLIESEGRKEELDQEINDLKQLPQSEERDRNIEMLSENLNKETKLTKEMENKIAIDETGLAMISDAGARKSSEDILRANLKSGKFSLPAKIKVEDALSDISKIDREMSGTTDPMVRETLRVKRESTLSSMVSSTPEASQAIVDARMSSLNKKSDLMSNLTQRERDRFDIISSGKIGERNKKMKLKSMVESELEALTSAGIEASGLNESQYNRQVEKLKKNSEKISKELDSLGGVSAEDLSYLSQIEARLDNSKYHQNREALEFYAREVRNTSILTQEQFDQVNDLVNSYQPSNEENLEKDNPHSFLSEFIDKRSKNYNLIEALRDELQRNGNLSNSNFKKLQDIISSGNYLRKDLWELEFMAKEVESVTSLTSELEAAVKSRTLSVRNNELKEVESFLKDKKLTPERIELFKRILGK
jgi:hypothetical protein